MSSFQFPTSIFPENENERLLKLHTYDILDTPSENTFDKIAILAAQIFNTPIAQVTFVDQERVFFKTNISPLKATEIDRKDSFCSVAILREEVTLIENMLDVPELVNNPFVTMENGVRFYAGAPLKTIEGHQLGTLCVLDTQPRAVTPEQLKMLETLSSIVMDELELRLASRKAIRTQNDMMNRIVHDLKNPNTAIALSAELIKRKANDPKIVADFAHRITQSANNVLTSLNNLLDISQVESGGLELKLEEVKILDVLHIVKRNFDLLASNKKQNIIVRCKCDTSILADARRMQEAFENLLSNALKYSERGTDIYINVSAKENGLTIEFKDEGQGLTAADMEKLFMKFARLSAVPTGKEHSNGLGLSIVKMLIELHKGKVWANSDGKNKGSSFFIFIPF
ncbi:MAG: GAF domain-containing sensor histidine kinase [Pedobacter sp.]|nr:GAF domain-containing sensor histidine kinase [Pedobacter sp.]